MDGTLVSCYVQTQEVSPDIYSVEGQLLSTWCSSVVPLASTMYAVGFSHHNCLGLEASASCDADSKMYRASRITQSCPKATLLKGAAPLRCGGRSDQCKPLENAQKARTARRGLDSSQCWPPHKSTRETVGTVIFCTALLPSHYWSIFHIISNQENQ
jgi:hypothetical protein